MAQLQKRSKIAIVGNVVALPGDDQRARAEQACRELGRELALAGYDIIAYSADRRFIEPFVVAGYATVEPGIKESIHVRYPEAHASITFDEATTHRDLFAWAPDQRPDWEMSFYESIGNAQGVLMLGGGASTLTAGLFAITRNVPTIAFSSFGGTARKIWGELSSRKELLTDEETAVLARPDFTSDIAKQAISLFAVQAGRIEGMRSAAELRRAGEAKRQRKNVVVAGLSFAAFLTLFLIAMAVDVPSSAALLALLIGGPAVAGVAGVSARLLDHSPEKGLPGESGQLDRNLVRGLVAGGIAALLAVVPTLAARPELPNSVAAGKDPKELKPMEEEMRRDQLSKLIPVAMITGFMAGFAVDEFYRKLRARRIAELNGTTAGG